MENAKLFFDNWLESQERLFKNLTETAGEFQKTFWGLGPSSAGNGGFQNIYDAWTKTVLSTLGDKGAPNLNVIRDTFAKSASGSNIYAKLYEIWLPLFKAIQEKTLRPEMYQDLTDPAKFKEVLDELFGFGPMNLAQFSSQGTKILESFSGSAKEFLKPWMEASESSFKTLPKFVEGHPESFLNIFNNMLHAFDSTFGKTFRIPAVGKDREKIEQLLRTFDDFFVFLRKNIEYKQLMYLTGIDAMGKVIGRVAEKIKAGEELKRFEDFFNLWLEVNEKSYLALFKTEAFSKLQGELLEADMKARKRFFKLMELYLYDFPIALRSEMDDLYKTVYELKKKVKTLEKQVQITK